jgi:glycerol kinase
VSGPRLVAGIDQGTTGTTVLLFDEDERVCGRGYRELAQSFPAPGQVEHDPEAIWAGVLGALADARAQVPGSDIAAVGITNQRETTVLWERATGRPVAPAIVWQDRRTAGVCEEMRAQGVEERVRRTTGLLLDPYFSATKMAWLLDHQPGLRERASRGELALGTIDSYLVFRMSGGMEHVTDVTNASRTLLLDLHRLDWSDELCDLFRVPRALLPGLRSSQGVLARTLGVPPLPDGTPIAGVAGDQQAALFGQGCVEPGDAKCTYGTGSFLLMNVGERPVLSRHRLVGTVAWQIEGHTSYALEGSAFIAGALVQWLRDGLGIIASAAEIEPLAASVPDSGGVTIVPALSGLGAPHWRPGARGLITGLTRGTTRAHLARAALEAIALQTVELAAAMVEDAGRPISALRVDGGAAANDLLMQIQADLLGADILRPAMVESTALGAARLAARGAKLMPSAPVAGARPGPKLPPEPGAGREVTVFHPRTAAAARARALDLWREAVARA